MQGLGLFNWKYSTFFFLHSSQIFIHCLCARHGPEQSGQSSEQNIVPVLREFVVQQWWWWWWWGVSGYLNGATINGRNQGGGDIPGLL